MVGIAIHLHWSREGLMNLTDDEREKWNESLMEVLQMQKEAAEKQ